MNKKQDGSTALVPMTGEKPVWMFVVGGVALGALVFWVIKWWRAKKANEMAAVATATTESTATSTTSSGTRSTGKPPNVSGNTQGYNTTLFDRPAAVRFALTQIGYALPLSDDPLTATKEVQRFQADWNTVTSGIDLGRVQVAGAKNMALTEQYRGRLAVDDVAGPNTLNALEIAFIGQRDNNVRWYDLVKAAKGT